MGLKLNLIIDYGNLVQTIRNIVEANRKKLLEQDRKRQIKEDIKSKEQEQANFGGPQPRNSASPGFPESEKTPRTTYEPWDTTSETKNYRETLAEAKENERRKSKEKDEKYRANKPGSFPDKSKPKLGHFWAFKDYKFQESGPKVLGESSGGLGESGYAILLPEISGGNTTIQKTNLVTGTGGKWDEFGGDSFSAEFVTTTDFESVFDEITLYITDFDTCEIVCPKERWQTGYVTTSSLLNVQEAVEHLAIPVGDGKFILITAEKYVYWQFNTIWTGGKKMYAGDGSCESFGQGSCPGGWNPISFPGNPNLCPSEILHIVTFVGGWADTNCETIYRYWGPYEATYGFVSRSYVTDTRRIFSAYICSDSNRREIDIPEKLQDFLDIQFDEAVADYPPPYEIGFNYTYEHSEKIYRDIGSHDLNSGYVPPANGNPGYQIDISKGLWTDNFLEGYTPEVFKWINNKINFVDGGKIKEFTNKKQIILDASRPDTAYGHILKYIDDETGDVDYPYASYLYNNFTNFLYATIPADKTPSWDMWREGYAGEKPKSELTATLRLRANRDKAEGDYNDYDSELKYYGKEDILGVVWDWDDPKYCKEMCIALGFSGGDLTI
jgi:hypothetical protein